MINDKKVVVVLPAHNAAATLEQTYREIPFDVVDEVILVDDHSSDETLQVAKKLGVRHVIKHEENKATEVIRSRATTKPWLCRPILW